MRVFVLDSKKRKLTPCRPKRARILLKSGKARVYRRYPFTIILKREVENATPKPLRIKIDPGSKTTGISVITSKGEVVFAINLSHRGQSIKQALESRRGVRRSRRQRKTRYRKPRFLNRRRKDNWIPPSLESRVSNILTWVKRLLRISNITSISQELVKFDLQKMDNPEIEGIDYQQGELVGYEVREYLLEKWGRKCAYCGKDGIPLEVEHIHPKSRGGTNRISNLTLSCNSCNKKKGTKNIEEFLKKKPEILKKVLSTSKKPLKDATVVNVTRWILLNRLKELGLEIETGSGGLTKYNRTTRKLPKDHWIDASCVGKSTPPKIRYTGSPLLVKATGHGNRQMCLMDKYGFPRTSPKGSKVVNGFQTGDIVLVKVREGKKRGKYTGKVSVRSTGYFNIDTGKSIIQGISYKYCKKLHSTDGYSY